MHLAGLKFTEYSVTAPEVTQRIMLLLPPLSKGTKKLVPAWVAIKPHQHSICAQGAKPGLAAAAVAISWALCGQHAITADGFKTEALC